MIRIDKQLLDTLSRKASESIRKRVTFDLRTSPNDSSQRVLNALELDTVVPIHRHRSSTEVVSLIRGRIRLNLFDDKGNVIESIVISPDEEIYGYSIPMGQWHNSECLESGTVFMEAKDGAYEPQSPDDIMNQ